MTLAILLSALVGGLVGSSAQATRWPTCARRWALRSASSPTIFFGEPGLPGALRTANPLAPCVPVPLAAVQAR